MLNNGTAAYRDLETVFAQYYYLKRVESILHWDTSVVMPAKSTEARAKQLGALQGSMQAVLANEKVPQLLESAAGASDQLSPWEQANLREMRALYSRTTALPEALRGALSQACVRCEAAWREARNGSDFNTFARYFAEVLKLVREKAGFLAEAAACEPYEALMREYDSERTLAQCQTLFDTLQESLPPLLRRAQQRWEGWCAPSEPALALSRQKKLCRIVLQDLGFDFDTGRLDQSLHPFTEGGFQDIRITTTYSRGDACKGLLGAIHEYGHAAYDAGLPAQWHSQPVGRDRGMSMHEGMALFYEMALARTPDFINYLEKTFSSQGWSFDRAGFSHHLLHVEPGCIRIDADELSYPAHILLRYRMERALLDGTLAVADIPECWNNHMLDLLGLQPKTLAEGCLQDIHWSMGFLGYFPSYAFGAVYAANLYENLAQEDVVVCATEPAASDFAVLGAWLRRHVADHGAFHREKTLQDNLGLNNVPRYLEYLEARYC
ncbi:Carboxypeptidase 1 [Halioglobus japonicus]|nr:Carboxypeptidase 1 [Halioglobus japonicus]